MLHRFLYCALSLVLFCSTASSAAPITAAAFSPDCEQVVVGSQAGIEVRSWPDLKVTSRLKTDLSHVHDLAFSQDGKVLIAAGGSPAEKGEIEVITWPDGKCIHRITDYKDLVYRVAWSADGSRLAAASADGTARIYSALTGQEVKRFEGHSRPVLAVVFLPDNKTVVSAGVDQTLQVWDAATGKHQRTLDNHTAAINDLALRPKGAEDSPPVVASVSDDRTVRLWQPTSGRLMRFKRLESAPRAVAWARAGDRLLVGCNDGKLRVLDPDTLDVVSEIAGVEGRMNTLIVNPKGEREVLAGGTNVLKLKW